MKIGSCYDAYFAFNGGVMTTSGAPGDDKVGIMTILSFQCHESTHPLRMEHWMFSILVYAMN